MPIFRGAEHAPFSHRRGARPATLRKFGPRGFCRRLAKDAGQVTVLVSAERISLGSATPLGSILMLFLAAIVRLTVPRESESNDLLVRSRLGNAGLTVITLIYVLIVLWRQ